MRAILALSILLTAAAASGYHVTAPTTKVHDIAEVNHVYELSGQYRFTQILAWDWNRITDQYNCAGWKIAPRDEIRVTPHARHTTVSGDGTTIHGRRYRETWYQWEAEVLDRDRWPESRRRGL